MDSDRMDRTWAAVHIVTGLPVQVAHSPVDKTVHCLEHSVRVYLRISLPEQRFWAPQPGP